MNILGLDPGLQRTGWGVIHLTGNQLRYVAHGVITPPVQAEFSQRLKHLYEFLQQVIAEFTPEEAAIEKTFVNTNAASSLKLGMARGVLLLAPAMAGLSVGEYAANTIKKSLVGQGHADKSQVAMMVQRLLVGCGSVVGDASDALAVAICHAHYRTVRAWAS